MRRPGKCIAPGWPAGFGAGSPAPSGVLEILGSSYFYHSASKFMSSQLPAYLCAMYSQSTPFSPWNSLLSLPATALSSARLLASLEAKPGLARGPAAHARPLGTLAKSAIRRL